MSKFLFFALGFLAAVLISYFGGWPTPRYDVYGEIKVWAKIVAPAVAILIAAYLGFRGVRETQRTNAKLARDQADTEIEREARRRRNASRDLARAIAAELHASCLNLRTAVSMVAKAAKKGGTIGETTLSAITPPSVGLYLAQLPNIGLLGELAGETVSIYDQIQTSIRHDAIILRGFEDGGAPIDASKFETKRRWGDRADTAEALAQRLENYDPPAD